MPREEGALSLAGEEAEVLALALGGDRQARAGGQLAHPRLRQIGEREAKRGQGLRSQRGEHVGLVLGRRRPARRGAGRRRRRPRGHSGRWPAPRLRAAARGRASRRSAPRRCRPHRGSGSGRPRGRAGNPSTTVSRKADSRSSVRWGSPSPWASARAPTTASGEQQLRAPSVRRSAHSFRVTATTSAPRRRSSNAATAESTPPLIATSTRSPPAGGSERLSRRGRGAQRPV